MQISRQILFTTMEFVKTNQDFNKRLETLHNPTRVITNALFYAAERDNMNLPFTSNLWSIHQK